MANLFQIPATATLTDLQDTLVNLSIEVAAQVGCPTKQALSASVEYRMTDYVNSAFGWDVMSPVTGCHGADAIWIAGGVNQLVEQKATEITPVAKDMGAGRLYTSPTFSFLDWPSQLTKRDRVMVGMHDARLDFMAALVVPPEGVRSMYDYAVTTYGLPAPAKGMRAKVSFSLKTILEVAPPIDIAYVLHGQTVKRYQFVEAFFGRRDPLYLNLFY